MRNEIIDQIENILYGVNMGAPQPDVEPGDSTGRVAARAVTRWLVAHDAEVAAKARVKALEDAWQQMTFVVEDVQTSRRPNPVSWQTGALAMRDWLAARAAGIREGKP